METVPSAAISYEDCTLVGVIAGSGSVLPLVFIVSLSISIALLPRAPTARTFYLLHAFAEEFTSVVCDPSHRVPHPLIKDCATDGPPPPS